MLIKQVPLSGVITTNGYFYIDEQSRHGLLIDAAAEPEVLAQIIKENDWVIEKILLTHGHFDHIGAVAQLHRQLGVPYYIYEVGKEMLRRPEFNLSAFMGDEIVLDGAQSLADGEVVAIETQPKMALKVIHVPGHTPDSKEKIMSLPEDTILYSGHSEPTTVANERDNPFLISV